jgi:hypothetical protein
MTQSLGAPWVYTHTRGASCQCAKGKLLVGHHGDAPHVTLYTNGAIGIDAPQILVRHLYSYWCATGVHTGAPVVFILVRHE